MARLRSSPDSDEAWDDLVASEDVLKQSGSTIEMAKTWAEMARYKLRLGEEQVAAQFASLAWERLSGFSGRLSGRLRPLLKGGSLPFSRF
jgi:hypothetical protein